MSDLEAFLAGERPDDVAFFLHSDVVSAPDALAEYATPVENGLVVVIDGEHGRDAFHSVTGVDPMELASQARGREGDVAADLSGGNCPDAAVGKSDAIEGKPDAVEGDSHEPSLVFAFAEPRNEEAGGIYAEGDVIHAYVSCSCGTLYSDRWVVAD